MFLTQSLRLSFLLPEVLGEFLVFCVVIGLKPDKHLLYQTQLKKSCCEMGGSEEMVRTVDAYHVAVFCPGLAG